MSQTALNIFGAGALTVLALIIGVTLYNVYRTQRFNWPCLLIYRKSNLKRGPAMRFIRPNARFTLPQPDHDILRFEIANFTQDTFIFSGLWEPKTGNGVTEDSSRPTNNDGDLVLHPFKSYRVTRAEGKFIKILTGDTHG